MDNSAWSVEVPISNMANAIGLSCSAIPLEAFQFVSGLHAARYLRIKFWAHYGSGAGLQHFNITCWKKIYVQRCSRFSINDMNLVKLLAFGRQLKYSSENSLKIHQLPVFLFLSLWKASSFNDVPTTSNQLWVRFISSLLYKSVILFSKSLDLYNSRSRYA